MLEILRVFVCKVHVQVFEARYDVPFISSSIVDDSGTVGGPISVSRSSAEGTAADCAAPIDTLTCAESA